MMINQQYPSQNDNQFQILSSGCNVFGPTNIAIESQKQPTRVIDLLGYQNLTMQAYQEY